MIIISINGQLGNQMFQYALGYHLECLGRKVEYDLSYFKQHPEHYFGLPLFGIVVPVANVKKVLAFQEDRHRFIDRLRRKVFGKHIRVFSEIGAKSYAFREDVFSFAKGYINGYWQSEKYFYNIAEEIRKLYSFPVSDNPKNRCLLEEIQECTSVSIHVRRGDYLGGFPVMDDMYFVPAMDYFRAKYNDVHFYVFSNDFAWCKKHFVGDDISYIDWNTGVNSIFDMCLMSQCKHNIIVNSSFSWWGAWLNQNPNKEVIAPDIWFFHAQTPDIYAKGWKVFSAGKLTV